MQRNKDSTYIAVGLIMGLIIGLFLDMYQIAIYGAVGLGIVYTPIIGLCLGVIICRLSNKKSHAE